MNSPKPNMRPPAPAAGDLADAVREAASATLNGPLTTTVDEQYTVTAVMVEHHTLDGPRTLCVELLDHGPDTTQQPRWMAVAYDELRERQTDPSSAATLGDALAALAWAQLDDDNPPTASGLHPAPTGVADNLKGLPHA